MCYVFSFLGMHFSQAVAIIQSQVGIIKGVQVLYSDTVRFYLFSDVNQLNKYYYISNIILIVSQFPILIQIYFWEHLLIYDITSLQHFSLVCDVSSQFSINVPMKTTWFFIVLFFFVHFYHYVFFSESIRSWSCNQFASGWNSIDIWSSSPKTEGKFGVYVQERSSLEIIAHWFKIHTYQSPIYFQIIEIYNMKLVKLKYWWVCLNT